MTADGFHYVFAARVVSLAIIGLLASGCGGAGDGAGRVSIDTLQSGTIVVRNGTEGLWSPGEAWRAVEVVRIGSEEAADPVVLFGDVWDVTLDGLGRIYVLDRQPKEVRVFDRAGRHVRTLGREGGGPGEFRNPIGLDWGPEGKLWVVDVGNARYTVFDTAGNYLDSHRREIGGWGYPWGGKLDIVTPNPREVGVRLGSEAERIEFIAGPAVRAAAPFAVELPDLARSVRQPFRGENILGI